MPSAAVVTSSHTVGPIHGQVFALTVLRDGESFACEATKADGAPSTPLRVGPFRSADVARLMMESELRWRLENRHGIDAKPVFAARRISAAPSERFAY